MLIAAPEQRRTGTITVWLLVCLLAILGILAMNMDGGRLMEERRKVQAAADAAALAAAKACADTASSGSTTLILSAATTAATTAAANNGIPIDGVNNTLTVQSPPTTGDYAGKDDYVQITLQSKIKATFARVFTQQDLSVPARATARYEIIGILCLNASAQSAMDLNGGATVSMPVSTIFIDSSNATAVETGSNTSLTAENINIVGGQSLGGSVSADTKTGTEAIADPLRAMPVPDLSAHPLRSSSAMSIPDNRTLLPGVYIGGISISGQAVVTMDPGVYIMDGGGFKVTGGTITGNGVMIYNTAASGAAGSIDIGGNGTVTLTPPLSGPYAGVVIFQDRTLTQKIELGGTGSLDFEGTVYAPAAAVTVKGTSDGTALGAIVCDTLELTGGGTIAMQPRTSSSPQLALIRLVE